MDSNSCYYFLGALYNSLIMKESLIRLKNIRNIGIKTVLALLGLLITIAVAYPFILERFYLTERDAIWTNEDWILLIVGFFLAIGGAYYNKIADGIANKFNNGKNEGNG